MNFASLRRVRHLLGANGSLQNVIDGMGARLGKESKTGSPCVQKYRFCDDPRSVPREIARNVKTYFSVGYTKIRFRNMHGVLEPSLFPNKDHCQAAGNRCRTCLGHMMGSYDKLMS